MGLVFVRVPVAVLRRVLSVLDFLAPLLWPAAGLLRLADTFTDSFRGRLFGGLLSLALGVRFLLGRGLAV